MLVIRRRPGEIVLIGEQVEIEVLEATPSQVKLGIRAPRSVTVLRKEIHLTREQNRQAARTLLPGAMAIQEFLRRTDKASVSTPGKDFRQSKFKERIRVV